MGGAHTLSLLLVSGLAFSLASYPTQTYHGHQLWRVKGEVDDVAALGDMEGVDVWGDGRGWVDVQVSPAHTHTLTTHLSHHALTHTVLLDDIQRVMDVEREVLKSIPTQRTEQKIVTNIYHQLEEIEAYLQELAASVSWVSVASIGQTSEGRDLWVATLSAPGGTSPKPSVWIDCGIHAREWITPATCIYGLDLLTENYGTDPDVTALLDKYDFYVLTVHNPDGYYYTWHNDRLWRKNRVHHPEDACYGVDLNRNFDDGHWGGVGTSDITCASTYCGPTGFSELESQAVRDYTNQLQSTNNLTAYFTIHSYGQMWMYAYGWTSEDTPHEQELFRVSEIGVTALRSVHDTVYTFGSIYDTIYPASGVSIDWSYSRGVAHTYTLELRDEGESGFLLPPDQIIPTAEETWTGLIAAIMAI
ncbi:hypothetical protein Pmani_039442 [Petrolisthes manimaculis]|uniref:Peptidase M14 domain-containing protein n=1 Tax=Petrolisthes manimaculis TaxID=1843537 RepID=A0AAE1NCP9_9EUCA|nr:hypothetical protein Pmani_039442 [Petrolisthes manimaculis]